MLSPKIVTNSNLAGRALSPGEWHASSPQIQGELCVVGSARRAQCVLGIIRISWNYTECLAGMWWRVNLANLHSLYTPSLLIFKRGILNMEFLWYVKRKVWSKMCWCFPEKHQYLLIKVLICRSFTAGPNLPFICHHYSICKCCRCLFR